MAKRQFAAKAATTLFASVITLSAAVSSPAFAADARDPGWYFGLQGGINSLSESTITNSSSNPQQAELGILGIIFPDTLDPVGGFLAGPICEQLAQLCSTQGILDILAGNNGGTPPASASSAITAEYDSGTAFGLTFGRAYISGMRPEGSVTYRNNKFKSVTFGPGNGDLSGQTTEVVEGEAKSISLMGNLWYDFNPGGAFQPYVGGGLGMTRVGFDTFSIGNNTDGTPNVVADGDDTIFAYQVGAGVGIPLGSNLMVSLDLRLMAASSDAEIDGKDGSKVSTDYEASSAMLGLRYYPKAGALSGDSDGDGVPDNLDKCPDTPLGVQVGPDGCPLDADGDGVPDNLDKCPGTPKGVSVGPDGCPVDSDGDGVPDYLDKCPGTATGVQVGPNGCALDADGDGVPDSLDKCPGSPAGIPVGADGCPLDSDNDGVPDYLDKCPGTPAGAIVDANGCEPDGDGDGVPDRLDRCPDTPPGQKVGPTGCPNDSDGDGVPDDMDECPNTPAGAQVLANGCALKGDCRTPRPGEEVDANGCAIDQVFILRGVNFEFDSDRLTPEAKEILKQVAVTLKAYPDVNVEIAGHTDSTGTDAYNLGLSEKRSIAVKNFLTTQTVDAARMTPNGYGESQPIDTNDTPEGQSKNRRVELRVIDESNSAVTQ